MALAALAPPGISVLGRGNSKSNNQLCRPDKAICEVKFSRRKFFSDTASEVHKLCGRFFGWREECYAATSDESVGTVKGSRYS